MFCPIMLPAMMTFCLFCAGVMLVTALSPLFAIKRLRTFFTSLFLPLLAFIPGCGSIETLLDVSRFGLFNYSDYRSIQDMRVERYLPMVATEIHIEKRPQGGNAGLKIRRHELDKRFDRYWQPRGRDSVLLRAERNQGGIAPDASFALAFVHLHWQAANDARFYASPLAEDGVAFFFWNCEEQGIAYRQCRYWCMPLL